jgi:dipeptide/tripeptide permease
LGGWIADNFLGKYWTIVGFSIPYVLGQILVGQENPYIFAASLALLAMGSGVIKPNISTLMGLTYDQQRPGQDKLRSDAFSLFYMAINVGALCSQLAMPILRENFGYKIAFLFPAGLMAIALTVFALGKKFYAKETIVKKKETTPEEVALKWATLKSIGSLFFLVTFFWAIFDQSSGTWIIFAGDHMNCYVFDLYIPPDALQWVNAACIIIGLPISMVLWRVLAAKGYNIRATDKMTVGFLLTGLTMAVMGIAAYSNRYVVGTELSIEKGTLIYESGGGINPKTGQGFFKKGVVETPYGTLEISDGEFLGKIGPKLSAEEKEARKNEGPISQKRGKNSSLTMPNSRLKKPLSAINKGKKPFWTGTSKSMEPSSRRSTIRGKKKA